MLEGLLTFSKGLPEDGPFFLGERFGGVDILLAPWALRMFLLKHFRGFEVSVLRRRARIGTEPERRFLPMVLSPSTFDGLMRFVIVQALRQRLQMTIS